MPNPFVASACFALALGASPAAPPDTLELVETAPTETTLAHADLGSAADVWLEMIHAATRSLDFAEFYASSHPGSRLEPVLEALGAAAARGVRVRFMADAGFAKKESATLERLEKMPGIQVRRIDWAKEAGGGIHHAKYFLVDGKEAFLGSQNFDWRSLEHIQELGVRVRIPAVVQALGQVFVSDWALAGGEPKPVLGPAPAFPVGGVFRGEPLNVSFVATPKGRLPDETEWSLPRLVALIDGAKKTVRVQVLTYQPQGRGAYFSELESALKRAAARGAEVSLLVSDWSKRPQQVASLKSLALTPRVTVKFLTVPTAKSGFIPYARVIHAKYLSVDAQKAWVGTSNWEGDYFFQSRNVGLIVDGARFARRLDELFLDDWNSGYVTKVDPCASYDAPRIGE
jgi:phosphatidylserine/phosphatidylglycerophosphate/cardiolipin synthase-like enzyme